MMDVELRCLTAEERQHYFEQVCEMDEQEFRALWENSEVRTKLEELDARLKNNV